MKAAPATPRPNDPDAPGSLAGIPAPDSIFEATRITVGSPHDFVTTRANFDRLVPAFDPLLARDLVLRKAAWTEVEDNIAGAAGPERPPLFRPARSYGSGEAGQGQHEDR
jgi:hypothetical protein